MNRFFQWTLLCFVITLPAYGWAGGLWILEYGAPAMGRAGAGAEAGVDNASTSQPASMARLDQAQFMATGGLVWSQIEFDSDRSSSLNGTQDGGDECGVV